LTNKHFNLFYFPYHKAIKDLRSKHLGPSLSLSYDKPPMVFTRKNANDLASILNEVIKGM